MSRVHTRRGILAAAIVLMAGVAMPALAAGASWANLAMISSTMGANANRLCLGEGLHVADIGCPTWAPYVSGTNGYMGIGTTSPSYPMHIVGDAQSSNVILMTLMNKYSNQGTQATLQFGAGTNAAGWPLAQLSGYVINSTGGGNGALLFSTTNNGTISERLRIDNVGRVGLGNAAPSQTLHVNGTAITTSWTGINFSSAANVTPTAPLEVSGTISATALVVNGVAITANGGAAADNITSGTTKVTVNSDTATISFTTNGSVANYLDSSGRLITTGISVSTNQLSATTGYFSGNVGIGTVSPGKKLEVFMSTGGEAVRVNANGPTMGIGVESLGGNYGVGVYYGGSLQASLYNTGLVLGSYAGTQDPPAGGLITSGNVGIGTTTPTATLQVSGSFIVSNSTQTTTPTLYVSGSNVGIGTINPSYSLHVGGGSSGVLTDVAQFGSFGSGAGTESRIILGTDPSHRWGAVSSYDSGTGGQGGLRFYTLSGGSLVSQATIDTNGTLSTKDIALGGSNKLYISSVANGYLSENYGIEYHGGSNHPFQVLGDSLLVGYNQGQFSPTTSTGRLLVSGATGIGTDSPSQTLHVSGTTLTTSWTGINFSSAGNVTPTARWKSLAPSPQRRWS